MTASRQCREHRGAGGSGDACFRFRLPSCSGFQRSPPMNRLFAAAVAAGVLCLASHASAFELFSLGGGYGCGCDAAPACCQPKCKKERCHKHRRCCDVSCGAKVPDCAAPTCAAPAPSCGFEPSCAAAPSCGYEKACGCEPRCCKQRCHKERCCKQRCPREPRCCKQRCHRNRCCENTCGCDIVKACGCGA